MSLKDAIREAAQERDQQANSPEDNNPEAESQRPSSDATQSNKAVNTSNSKAVKPQSKKAVNTVSHKTAKAAQAPPIEVEEEPEELAAMTVRVFRRHRLHWLISAKKQRTTLTAAITEALNARFGEPED